MMARGGTAFRRVLLCAAALAVAAAGPQAPSASGTTTAANTWEQTAALDACTPPSPSCMGRTSHAAVLLANRQVLLVGGKATPATAQIYDPATGSWSPTGPMEAPAGLPIATLLPNGNVLVIGEGDPQVYDPDEDTWTTAPAPPTGHTQGTATLLTNGKVLVAGGLGGEVGTAAADLYDPEANSWEPTGALIELRSEHEAVLLPDGKVLVTGGFSENYGPKRETAELYDPETGAWSPTGAMASGVIGHTATLLGNGQVLVAGGQSEEGISTAGQGDRLAQLYDPQTGSWSATGEMASGRSAHAATLLPDGTVLVVGGVALIPIPGGEQPVDTTPAELFDPSTGAWAAAAAPGVARTDHTATLLPAEPASACGEHCGKVLVAGGRGRPGEEGAVTPTHAELYEAPPGSVSAPLPTAPAAASSDSGGTKDADDASSFPLGVVLAAAVVVAGAAVFLVVRGRQHPKGR